MADDAKRSDALFIDYARHRASFEARRRQLAQDPAARNVVLRASIHVLKDQLKEARVGRYVIRSDEPTDAGGDGEAPAPMQYFVAAIGF